MSTFPPQDTSDLRWIVRSLDGKDVADKRQKLHADHVARLRKFKSDHPGVLEYGGPILDVTNGTPKGSVLHLLYGPVFDSAEKVKTFLNADPFIINQVYDPAQCTIELYHAKHFPLSFHR